MSDISIASITTAYNAAHLLPRQIDALLAQSRPLQEIVIVDNASTDHTLEMLAERYPHVTVLRLQKNAGAAGAWAAGLEYAALQKKHDWVWNFDDDSVPHSSALESMLTGAEEAATDPAVGMLAPLPVHAATGTPYPPWLWRDGFVRPSETLTQQPVWFADAVIASGCMVRREAAEKIGVPRADFFMDFFDFEYSLRMRSQGYRIAVVKACKFSHEIGDARTFRFFGLSHTWTEHAPWRQYYIARNITYAARWLYPSPKTKLFVALHLLRHAAGIALFSQQKGASLKKMAQGALDGWCGRLGIRFLPRQGSQPA